MRTVGRLGRGDTPSPSRVRAEQRDRGRSETASTRSGPPSAGGGEPLLSRRRLLKAGGAGAAGAALVWGLGTNRRRSADQTDIVYAMTRSEPGTGPLRARTREVPTDWYENTQRAFAIQDELRKRDLPSLLGSFAIPGSYDEPAASITVDTADEGPQETLEELSGDLAIDLNIIDGLPSNSGAEFRLARSYQVSDLDRKRVPGGFTCQTREGFGTLAPALFDERDGSRYFATSNHVYGAGGTKKTEHEGEPLSLRSGERSRHIGHADRGYPLADIVRVSPIDGYRPVPAISRGDPGTVIGQYTREGLADLMARGEELEKIGALSDHTSGQIAGINGITCYVGSICKRGQLKWGDEDTMTDGDSGSVNFRPDPEHPEEYAIVGGINNARTWWPGAGFTWGTAAHHLLDEYGLHF